VISYAADAIAIRESARFARSDRPASTPAWSSKRNTAVAGRDGPLPAIGVAVPAALPNGSSRTHRNQTLS
jgi:hypothetical protein